jgi:hypothetical protein
MSTTGASFASKTMYFEKYDKYLKFEVLFANINNLDMGHCRTGKI